MPKLNNGVLTKKNYGKEFMLIENLIEKIKNHSAGIGIIGLGYVGLPLALEFANKGFPVTGFDVDEKKIPVLKEGLSYIKHIHSDRIRAVINSGKFFPTTDFSLLSRVDVVIICVPTPLNEHREPDMTYIIETSKEVQKYFKRGQLIVLESTTYPGTTEEILLPFFEQAQLIQNAPDQKYKNKLLKAGEDFFLAFSPEREDPNNAEYSTSTIPKVVGGVTPNCLNAAKTLYDQIVVETVPVSCTKTAEATKLLENIYRAVNIALVNELKIVFNRMGIDIWEVIEAAKTKPFGFQPFYPGPGLGGHCIPIDPFYLTWKAREYDIHTKFIELAGEINTNQPYYVVEKAVDALNKNDVSLNGAKILILGAAYKKDIDDLRESPSLKLIEIFRERGAVVDYHDPYIPKLPKTRKYQYELESIKLSEDKLAEYDLVLLSTDHNSYDYEFIMKHSRLIVDTRNAFKSNGVMNWKVIKA
jgi:UDP-N-acetyl-D-glucosamine dehydrogenase